jgi:hypothetical protein
MWCHMLWVVALKGKYARLYKSGSLHSSAIFLMFVSAQLSQIYRPSPARVAGDAHRRQAPGPLEGSPSPRFACRRSVEFNVPRECRSPSRDRQYSQAIPTSIPKEFSATEPYERTLASGWALPDEVNLEDRAVRFPRLRPLDLKQRNERQTRIFGGESLAGLARWNQLPIHVTSRGALVGPRQAGSVTRVAAPKAGPPSGDCLHRAPNRLRPGGSPLSTNYFGGVGVEPGATIVPQRGQCAQATSIGDWQELQVGGAVEVTVAERAGVEALLSSSGSAAIPFLNSFMDLPSDFARSGSLLPPKSTKTITRISSSSW